PVPDIPVTNTLDTGQRYRVSSDGAAVCPRVRRCNWKTEYLGRARKLLERVDEVSLDLRQLRPFVELAQETLSFLLRHPDAHLVLMRLCLHPTTSDRVPDPDPTDPACLNRVELPERPSN